MIAKRLRLEPVDSFLKPIVPLRKAGGNGFFGSESGYGAALAVFGEGRDIEPEEVRSRATALGFFKDVDVVDPAF